MNPVNPKKLLHSKWTATNPKHKEKHFVVSTITQDDDGAITECVVEALMSKRQTSIDWRTLKDPSLWRQGWQ